MNFRIRVRLLPVLVLVSMLTFAVRMVDFYAGLEQIGEARAQEKTDAAPPPMPADAKKPGGVALPAIASAPKAGAAADAKGPDAVAAAADKAGGPNLPPTTAGKQGWKDATEDQYSCSDTQNQLNQDLAKRRDDLDRQSKDLAMKQALLTAGQHELDQKVAEMTSLRNQIQSMMGTLTEQEKARIQSLVKIYESMKPADAARIFNTLDTDVVLEVMGQMKEAKSALVLAAMDSARAKTITVMLAQQKRLPDVPADGAPAAGK